MLPALIPVSSAGAEDVTVSQKGQVFSPGELTVKAGQEIAVLNDDRVPHNVYYIAPDRKKVSFGIQKPGQNMTMKLEDKGTYRVRCAIHLNMKMTVVVE